MSDPRGWARKQVVEDILDTWKREREAEGFVVDTTCWPWFAYTGPRFNVTLGWVFGDAEPLRYH